VRAGRSSWDNNNALQQGQCCTDSLAEGLRVCKVCGAALAAWEKVDRKALQLTGSEGIFDLQVRASIADKSVGEPDDNGELPEFGAWSETKRQINFYLPIPQDRNTLARVLIYCWKSCLDPKVPTIKDALVELSRVAAEQGWVTLTDVIKETHKANKGGRRKGSRNKDTTEKYVNCFKRLKAENPEWGDEALLNGVVAATGRRGWSNEEKAAHRINVKKALQRERPPLYPKKSRQTRKST
jgi:hypothetical protein